MDSAPQLLLIGAVGAVGVLHTLVPDHWAPIALIARQRGWSKRETARAALVAGAGHVVSTLAIALIVWAAGAALAQRAGGLVDTAASAALVLFGGWIAISAWREMRAGEGSHAGHAHHHRHDHLHSHPHGQARPHGHGHEPAPARHWHMHRHESGPVHAHWHVHSPATAHAIAAAAGAEIPLHEHAHAAGNRAALLLILGSSPMVEGIPAFFAAGRYGPQLIAVMAAVFAAATIATYVLLCTASASGLQRVSLGPVERYGEVLSGVLVAAVGFAFWLWPVL